MTFNNVPRWIIILICVAVISVGGLLVVSGLYSLLIDNNLALAILDFLLSASLIYNGVSLFKNIKGASH